MNTKTMTQCALASALLCILAPIAIPLVGGVPISLTTLLIMIFSLILGSKKALICVGLYIIIGCLGFPVFANYASGLPTVFGPTGGFIIGYLFLAYFTNLFFQSKKTIFSLFLGILLGHFFLYLLGTCWFSFIMQVSIKTALVSCMIPFLSTDSTKIGIVLILGPLLAKRIPIH